MKGGGSDMETRESIGQTDNPMRLHDGTPISLTVKDSVFEMNRKTGFRQESSVNFTPRFNKLHAKDTPIEIPVGQDKAEYFKVIGKAMKGQELPGVYVAPIESNEFEDLKKKKGGAVQPDNLDQLP